jgi:hypothetical protein
LIDPGDFWESGRRGDLAVESFGMLGIGVEKDHPALFPYRLGPAVVHVGRGMESNARVAMIVVIPAERSGTVGLTL